MKLIATTIIGVLLLAGIGAAASITTTETTTKAGQSSVYFFDVPATASHGAGTLMINLAEHRFVYDGQGEPGKVNYLQYTLKNRPGVHTFASAAATSSGALHMEGLWVKKFGSWATKVANMRSTHALGFAAPSGNDLEMLATEPTFALSNSTPLTACFTHGRVEVQINGVTYIQCGFDALGSTQGADIRYRFTQTKCSGAISTLSFVYDGPSIRLNDTGYFAFLNWLPDDKCGGLTSITVYDQAGNSASRGTEALNDHLGVYCSS